MATHLLVGNPTAQSGRNAARFARAQEHLRGRSVACDFLATLPEGATIGAVRDALDGGGYRVVITMGGDGTFREVASGSCQLRAGEEAEEAATGLRRMSLPATRCSPGDGGG